MQRSVGRALRDMHAQVLVATPLAVQLNGVHPWGWQLEVVRVVVQRQRVSVDIVAMHQRVGTG